MISSAPALITLDWGTTSLRAYLHAADGTVLDSHAAVQGIMSLDGSSFAEVLTANAGAWAHTHGKLPVLLSGMIGSRQGWVEARYVALPAGLPDLAAGLTPVPDAPPAFGPVSIVPGLLRDEDAAPDVIRGEEVEVFGALHHLGVHDGLFVLPGTHSKWVRVEAGRIVAFSTYMTGDVFAALRGHTILGRMMQADAAPSPAGFRRGVEAARGLKGPGALMARLFSARTLPLTGRMAETDSADYLSGLLIGAELNDATHGHEAFTLVANPGLTDRYATAAEILGLPHHRAPAQCGSTGQFAVARAAGLI
ncbi:2-dehydro-3-deoxygalactonokinase [Azorhizobium oxalatiphilum]|uniref:2-dehydro-3-deoxygalactonokinase n=1 Tax=Azorhizobium oxalatiphilum TaxID=980631 RepID=A0A917CB33_9HYPH|nr:2-dehydro-3-deoxygalactonokinase [Azorhizobium oxalatiphilum]GGF77616.1 2-dehydro-3-deoxygalactonokinase [Azorhizobium oxalatiphilum]